MRELRAKDIGSQSTEKGRSSVAPRPSARVGVGAGIGASQLSSSLTGDAPA